MRIHTFLLLVTCASPLVGRAQAVCDSLHTILGSFFEHQGMMFSVVATAPVTLDHISANLFPGTRQYALYTRMGGYVAHTDDPTAWTPLDTVTVTSANIGFQQQNTAVLPITLNIELIPGDTVSFFLTDQTANGLFSFGNLTAPGNVVESDTHIGITVAYALPRNFGLPYGTYEWSGRVAYCLTEEQGIPTLADDGYSVIVTSDAITVSAPGNVSAVGSPMIELRELSGRLVRSSLLQGTLARISTVGLAAAPYVLVVAGDRSQMRTQRVVVH